MKNPAKTFQVSISANAELAKRMNLTPASLKTQRSKGWIKRIINGLKHKNLGSWGLCVSRLSAMEGGDRVNAELQHAPAISKMPQVGVPALAGLSVNWEMATA